MPIRQRPDAHAPRSFPHSLSTSPRHPDSGPGVFVSSDEKFPLMEVA